MLILRKDNKEFEILNVVESKRPKYNEGNLIFMESIDINLKEEIDQETLVCLSQEGDIEILKEGEIIKTFKSSLKEYNDFISEEGLKNTMLRF